VPVLLFILRTASTIFAVIILLFIVSWLPGGAVSSFAGAVLGGVGALFGALPEIIRIALDRARAGL
jgi:hypothetical protein